MLTSVAVAKDKILIISSHQGGRALLETSLKESGYDVLIAPNEQAALELLQQVTPALVVVDRQFCNYSLLRAQKELRTAPIIAIQDPTEACGEDECIEEIEKGADLVFCGESTREIIARVRAMLRRTKPAIGAPVSLQAGGVKMDLDRHEVRINDRLVELTPKEFQILRHFLQSPNRVFSRQEMLNCVWGEGYALEEHALDVHIHSVRHKIEENPERPKLIVTVRGIGYKFRASTS